MPSTFTVAFFGHRYIDTPQKLEPLLEECIEKIVCNKDYTVFLVGNNGDFDRYASSAVTRIKRFSKAVNTELILVLPYHTADYLLNRKHLEDYYDRIEISEKAAKAHPKRAIEIRNSEMIDRSDLIVCYVNQNNGGAHRAVKYALSQGKSTVNLANEDTTQIRRED